MTYSNVGYRLRFDHRHAQIWCRSDSRWARYVANCAMTHRNVCRRLKFEHRHERSWRRSHSRWACFVVNSAMTQVNMCHQLKCEWTQTAADLTLIARADLTLGSLRGEKCPWLSDVCDINECIHSNTGTSTLDAGLVIWQKGPWLSDTCDVDLCIHSNSGISNFDAYKALGGLITWRNMPWLSDTCDMDECIHSNTGGGLGSSTIFKNLMSPTPRRKWYLTTGRRAH